VNIDMIIQSQARDGKNDISLAMSDADLPKGLAALAPVKTELRAADLLHEGDVAKIAVVGVGMRSHPGVASKMFQTLADHKINIQMISTSEIKISCVIRQEQVNEAVKVLHETFELAKKEKA